MQVVKRDADEFQINLTQDGLRIICQCMNEVCNGINLSEFVPKIGADRDRVRAMLDILFYSAWKDDDGGT